jgi:hypothetical protein
MPFYWIDLEAEATARLTDVDRFLRRLWLECGGHFSVFHVGSTTYTRAMAGAFGERDERSLSARLGDALSGIHGWFGYEYDFGSTTALRLRVVGVRGGAIGRGTVRLLARNAPPAWRCSVCNEPAAFVCSLCNQETDECFVCRRHAGEHACEMKTEGLLPVVNSPRMGVCGYTGEQARAGWRPSDGK